MDRVLEGMRVADLTAVMAGPSGAMFLADLGADVVKVETVEAGDYARGALPHLFEVINRNKRSIAVDLATDEGLEVAKRLVATCDVVVQGYRPGALAAKGLGGPELCAEHPRLIYASLSGYGSTGPGAGKRGHDQLVQVDSGMVDVMDGLNQRLGLIDAAAGIALGQAVLAALLRRERTGRGEQVEVNLYDTALWLQMAPIAEYSVTQVPPQKPAEYALRIPTGGLFEAADGRVFISVLHQHEWLKLCELLGQQALLGDPRFADPAARRVHGAVLKPLLEEAIRAVDVATLLDFADREGMLMSSVKTYDDVFDGPQAAENGTFQTIRSVAGDDVVHVRAPYRLLADGEGARFRRAPDLGEHTAEVLADLGYSAAEIASMLARSVVRGPT